MNLPTGAGKTNTVKKQIKAVNPNIPIVIRAATGATLAEIEENFIAQNLKAFRGNLTAAATSMGIGRATLYRKVKLYNLDFDQFRPKTV